jgi:hypothetical protein|tara:strand:- start:177 stop:389 length:213 start_codon:yes stop_codon:yes gene_type:complete
MKVVDLHGVRYGDVYGMLENLCVEGDYPFVVVTGKSDTMKSVVKKVVSTFGLHTKEKLGNSGRLIVCESR